MSSRDSLKNRLGYLRTQKKPPPVRPASKDGPPGPDWERTADFVWERTAAEVDLPLPVPRPPLFSPPGTEGTVRFFDLETTGLSGGAGTIAFLAGVGAAGGGRFSVHQIFLSDFPGEADFLRALTARLPAGDPLVSYNGKSYDINLLRTRCLMKGLSFTPPNRHADLLYPSRVLFKAVIGRCCLQDVETGILAVHREGDIPGALIPDIYFDYLKTRDPGGLEGVFEHNVQDILSLAHLLIHIQGMLDRPFNAGQVDPAGLGRLLMAAESPAAEEYLLRALRGGDLRAGRLLALHLKRQRRYEEADTLWALLAETFGDPFAAVERAKHLEHRCRKPEEALVYLTEMSSRNPRAFQAAAFELEHRIVRLRRKSGEKSAPGRGR